jgi:imidazolonepropionase-like amidohydrolase
MKKYYLLLFACLSLGLQAQIHFPNDYGVHDVNKNYTAITQATIYVTPTQVLENATLLIKDGKVVSVGANVSIPANTVVIEAKGKTIYPSFVDLYANFGIKTPQGQRGFGRSVQYESQKDGYYWNEHIKPETAGYQAFEYDAKKADELRKAGFGTVLTHMQDGVARGTGLLVGLNDDDANNTRVLQAEAAQFFGFTRSQAFGQSYPTSVMGMTALLRQLHHDAIWYQTNKPDLRDFSIEAFLKNKNLPQIFDAGDKLADLRVGKLSKDMGINFIVKGGGDEFERIDEIAKLNASFILPVNFPDAYDVSDPTAVSKVSLDDLRFWNQAPANAAVMAKNNIRFSFTADGLKSPKNFLENVRKAVTYGLDKTVALEALTTRPAAFIGKSNELGNLKSGALANFIITSGDLFEDATLIHENWVQGKRNIISDLDYKDIRGTYNLSVSGTNYTLKISGSADKPKGEITQDSTKLATKFDYDGKWVNILFNPAGLEETAYTRLNANVLNTQNISGSGTLYNGAEISWSANRTEDPKDSDRKKPEKQPEIFPVTFPNVAFGYTQKPQQQTILFKNATVWTNESEGIMQNADVLVKNGKIAAVGKNLTDASAKVIDATGKHLTSGIIDEHSHIGLESVNEAGSNSSAEVTMEDVIDSEDVNLYRNLAGGVTISQLLHGSANPIGGRSAIIKLKWGEAPDDLIFDAAPKFIKFALGENVKQSNWGIANPTRYPQSRMGVEQVYVDYFTRAKEYESQWQTYNKLSAKEKQRTRAPRYDLEMETLVEILNGERFITCHSYVQSEINMMMKVAEQFNFRVNTFTHILEGYKVADIMAKHGVGGSTFSDWWSYKYEVKDAIPYNGALMHQEGVVVAFNSDDAEMSRRLNQEAAKAVKYGNVPEEEAWKFVTLNPAKLLHIDDRVGSIKVGKDADLVLWTDHPMSVYAKVEKNMIEGKFYFELDKQDEILKRIQEEKNKLINLSIEAKNKGLKTQQPKKKEKELLHCDSLDHQFLVD